MALKLQIGKRQRLSFKTGLGPRGFQGEPGDAATIAVGTVTTVGPNDPADVTNVGTSSAAIFDFEIPQGEKGDEGDAATIAVGDVTTVGPSDPATVTNVGTSSAAVFDFEIPKGDKGDQGDPGTITNVKNSIEVDSGDVQLVGDQATPGNNKVYGTDGAGNKGWKNDPAGGGGASHFFRVRVVDTEDGDPTTDYEDGDEIDGVTLAENDAVLRASAADPEDNGVYVVPASGAASRHASYDDYDDLPGVYFSAMEGASHGDTLWRVTSDQGGTIDSTALTIEQASFGGGGGGEDFLLNGNGQINQQGASTLADDAYGGHDQWYALTQTNTITPSSLTDVQDGLPHMMRLSQSQASAQRMGYAQIIEANRCKKMRGETVYFRGKFRYSNAAAIRFAILEWTGTADSVTSDVVDDWTDGSYAAGDFFIASNLTVRQVGSITPGAATITDFSISATLGSSFNNLILFVWTEGTAAQNSTLDIAAQLGRSPATTRLLWRDAADELELCRRYYRKLIEPPLRGVVNGTTSVNRGAMPLSPPMRATPTVTLSGVLPVYDGTATSTVNNITLNASTADFLEISADGATGLTDDKVGIFYRDTGAGFLELSARL